MASIAPSPEQQLVLDSFQQSVIAAEPAHAEAAAKAYAAALPEPLLAQVVAFLETPAGKAWAGASGAGEAALNLVSDRDEKDLMVNARHRLCRQIVCLPRDTLPTPAVLP
jgi:hypothetical protein